MFTPEQIKIANSTSRNTLAIGSKAITPKYVEEHACINNTILDFGAGKDAAHTRRMRVNGFRNVVAYEFGDNVNEWHDDNALLYQHDYVFASNVLNVQQDIVMLMETVGLISNTVKIDGTVVMNYPLSPRKIDMNAQDMQDFLELTFDVVERVGGTKQAPLFKCKLHK